MPKPKENEKKKEFISRCIGDNKMCDEFPDQKQRIAVCYSYADKHYGKTQTFKEFIETDTQQNSME